MSDLHIIKKIEEKIGEPLQQLTLQQFEQLGPKSREKEYQHDENGNQIYTRRNPKRLFVVDEQDLVIVLWVDHSPKSLDGELKQLKKLQHGCIPIVWKTLCQFKPIKSNVLPSAIE